MKQETRTTKATYAVTIDDDGVPYLSGVEMRVSSGTFWSRWLPAVYCQRTRTIAQLLTENRSDAVASVTLNMGVYTVEYRLA